MNFNLFSHALETTPHTLHLLGLGQMGVALQSPGSLILIDPFGVGDIFTAGFLSRWLEEGKPLEREAVRR